MAKTVQPTPALGQPESATDDDGLIRILRQLFPERLAEQIMAGYVPVTLGRKTFRVPVLAIEPGEAWIAKFNEELGGFMSGLDSSSTDAGTVLRLLRGLSSQQMTLVRAYDTEGVLPEEAWIRANATPQQLLSALLAVSAAAFPFVATALDLFTSSGDLQAALRAALRQYTSGPPPNTAGALNGSGEN